MGADLEQAVTQKSALLAHALQRRHAGMRSSQDLHHRNFKASAELLSIRSLMPSRPSLRRTSGLKRPRLPATSSSAATQWHPYSPAASAAATPPPAHGHVAAAGFSAGDLLASLRLSTLPAAATLPIAAPRRPPSAALSDAPHPRRHAAASPVSAPSADATISHIAAQLNALRELAVGVQSGPVEPGQWWLQTAYPVSDPLACEVEVLASDMTGRHTACMATQYACLFSLQLDLAIMAAGATGGTDGTAAYRGGTQAPPPASRAALTAAVEELLAPVSGVQLDPLHTPLTLTSGPGQTIPVATGVANIVSAVLSVAQRRLQQHVWLQAVATFIHSRSARGPPFADGACGHPQKRQAGAASRHDPRRCPRCCVLVCTLRALKSMLQGSQRFAEVGPLVSPGPAQPLLPLLLERAENVMTMSAIARARWLESDPKGFCRMFHAGGDVRTAFLRESSCAVEVFRLLHLQPQQLRLAHDLWESWRSRRAELDAALRTAHTHLDTLVAAADLSQHAPPPPGPAHSQAARPATPQAQAAPPSSLLPQPPTFARPRRPGSRRNTLPPLHGAMPRPPSGSRLTGTGWPGAPMLSGGWGSVSGAALPHTSSPALRLRRFSSGGSGGASSAAGSAGGSAGFAELSPGVAAAPAGPSGVMPGEPCLCKGCVTAMAPKLLGVGADMSAAAQAAVRKLRGLQAEDLALCARTLLGVNTPGAFFSAEQMLAAAGAAMRHGMGAVDWLWVLSMASQQLHMSGRLANMDEFRLDGLA